MQLALRQILIIVGSTENDKKWLKNDRNHQHQDVDITMVRLNYLSLT